MKVGVMLLSVIITTSIVVLDYSQGANPWIWAIFSGIFGVCIVAGGFGYYFRNEHIGKPLMYGAGLTFVLSLIALLIDASENKDDTMLKTGGENPLDSGNNSYKGAFWFALGLLSLSILIILILLIIAACYKQPPDQNKITYALFTIVACIIMMSVLQLNPDKQNKGENLFNWYVPRSFKMQDIFMSGFAYSIYAVIIGAIISKLGASSFKMALGVAAIMIVSVIAQAVWDKNIDTDDQNTYSASWLYYLLLGMILLYYCIIVIIEYSGSNILDGYMDNLTYAVPFLVSTMFGVLPISVFLIIINYSIASFAPSMALFFMILYRIAGMVNSQHPNSGLGKILLAITGKRETDVWVMPFLPWVTYIIKAYYLVKGDKLPSYFDDIGLATGVTNKNMWLS